MCDISKGAANTLWPAKKISKVKETYERSELNWTIGQEYKQKKPVLRIRDVYPGSRILIFTHSGSRISDPGSKNSNKREVWKKFVVATNFRKLKISLFFKCWRKKFGPVFKELYNFLPKTLSLSSKKKMGLGSGIWDPEKNLFRIPDPSPGVKRHRIPDPDPQHWKYPHLMGLNRTPYMGCYDVDT